MEKSKPPSLWLPVLLSIVVCVIMYVGEAVMMDGTLYRFGIGWFFAGIPGISVAIVDLLVILLCAVITAGTLNAVRKGKGFKDGRAH